MITIDYIAQDGKLIKTFQMKNELSLDDIAQEICIETKGKFPVPTIALVGSKPAVKKYGDWKIKLSNATVQFRQLVMGDGGGGGSNPMQMIMQVAIIALAAAATWYIGGTGAFMGINALGMGSLWGGLAGAGIMMLGTMLMGALFQQKLPQGQVGAMNAEQSSPTYNINSSGNRARLYQQEPECFGRMKIVPDFVANSWTQFVNNDQIGYFVYGIGRGHYKIESLSFGETVFWRNGNFIDSGYTNSGTPQSVWHNVELKRGAGYSNPFLCQGVGQETKKITVILNFPDGLCNFDRYTETETDSDGNQTTNSYFVPIDRTATFSFQVQQVDANNNPVGSWINLGNKSIVRHETRAFTESFTFNLPDYKKWRLRAANISPNQSSDKTPIEGVALQKIEYTPVGITIEIVEPGNPVTIFPDNIITSDEVSGQELFAPNEEGFTGALGPYTTNSPGTTTNKILFDFTFQQGIGRYNSENKLVNFTISWRIEYRRIDDNDNPISGWATLDAPSITMATSTPQRITKTYEVPNGRYMCRVVRTSDTQSGGSVVLDTMNWASMKAMLPGTYKYPITCIAINIKASNTLTQNASQQFSAIVTRKLPLYNRTTKKWSEEVPTRSWAAAVSHVCKCEWGGRLKDANIDLDTLWAIDAKLQAKSWFYDSYIDGAYLVWTLLCEMCQSQCVIPRLLGPILSFVQDAPNRAPSFALTPRNIVRNSFGLSYMTWNDSTPDDVIIEYLDANFGFQQRDVTAKLPDSESKEPSSLDILGITDRSHAHKVAVAYAAHNRWQRVVVECQVEALGRIINKGDICTVAHPRFKNTAAGIVKWWDQSELSIGLHQDMNTFAELENTTLYMALQMPNSKIWGPCKLASFNKEKAIFDQADYSNLLLQGQGNPFEWMTSGADKLPTNWTLYKAKTYQRLMVVDSITAQDMLHYNLKLLNYDSRIYQYDNLPVPPWQGRGQLPNESEITIPQNFNGIINSATSVTLRWSSIPAAQWYELEISDNNENWQSLGRININQTTISVSAGKIYARVRGVSNTMIGGWALWAGNTTVLPPVAPTLSLSQSYIGGYASVSWNNIQNANEYILALNNGNSDFFNAIITSNEFEITPEIQEGGPYRNITCSVIAVGDGGSSKAALLTISDPVPSAPVNANISIDGNSATINSVSPAPTGDFTGYVLVKGNTSNFGTNQVQEIRQIDSFPYTWSNLPDGDNYFRIAVKDAFFEITNNLNELNFSSVLTVSI